MRKIKKLAALCMAGVLAASMAACSGGETAETTTAAPATTAAETTAEETAAEEAPQAEEEKEDDKNGREAVEKEEPSDIQEEPSFTARQEYKAVKSNVMRKDKALLSAAYAMAS